MKSITFAAAFAALAFTGFTFAAPTPDSLDAPSTTGTCSDNDNRCVGDITYYGGGLGACGWNVDTNTQNEIALPYDFMGTQSNGNPYCGQGVTVYNPATGNTALAIVGDKCMSCIDRSIDLTQQLFGQLTNGNFDAGVEDNVQWWFN